MADLETIRAAIETQLGRMTASTLGGTGNPPVRWRGRKSDWRGTHLMCFLGTPRTLGRDSITEAYDDDGDPGAEITLTQTGARLVTLEVQARSYRSSGGLDAREYTRRIRDRMLLPSVHDALAAVGVSIGNVAMDRDLSEVQDDRDLSIAQIDINLNVASSEAEFTTWIEYVKAETDFVPDVVEWSGTMKVG